MGCESPSHGAGYASPGWDYASALRFGGAAGVAAIRDPCRGDHLADWGAFFLYPATEETVPFLIGLPTSVPYLLHPGLPNILGPLLQISR